MEIVHVLQESEEGLLQISGAVRLQAAMDRFLDDVASVIEAIAVHDNRWDI